MANFYNMTITCAYHRWNYFLYEQFYKVYTNAHVGKQSHGSFAASKSLVIQSSEILY